MCGRFGFYASPAVVAEEFELPELPEFTASYNVAPTHDGPTVGENPETKQRSFSTLRWGLIPYWSDGPDDFSSDLINARAETVHEKPAFRKQFRSRRCLIPASGFYEWESGENGKQPYWIYPTDRDLFGMAGLWDVWSDDGTGDTIASFTIVTTEANDRLAPLHHRMPVILSPDEYDTWLDPDVDDTPVLRDLLDPAADSRVAFHPVSKAVNNPGYDQPDCVEPVEASDDGETSGQS